MNINNTCNNNNNSSCNNNHNESFSKLFYQVIHNKYIFNLIFHHLHSRYDDYNQNRFKYTTNGQTVQRIKFKDIVSLKFMLENRLYHLIKCKLEANDYIIVDMGKDQSKYWLSDVYDQDRQLSIEIAKLILKSTSISNPDDPFVDIHLLNPELIQIATDPLSPHSIQVQLYMIQNAFNKSTTPQIKALLDSFYGLGNCTIFNTNNSSNKLKRNLDNLDISYNSSNNNSVNSTIHSSNQLSPPSESTPDYINQFKNQIVNLAVKIKDPFQRNRALESILSNSQYYNIPPSESQSSISNSTTTNKRIKISQDSTPSSSVNSDLDIQLINIQDIVYKVISIDIQNQLLDLNYYYIPESLSTFTDQINNIINNNNNNGNNNQLKHKRSKELLELFRDNVFLNKFDSNQLIDIWSWFYDLEKLQIIVSNNQDDWRGWNTEIEQYINSINLAESEEHIKYYQSLQQIQELNHINQYIQNRVSEQLSQRYRYGYTIIQRLESLKNNNSNKCDESLELDIDTVITSINNYSESGSVMELYNSLSSLITLQYQSNNITTDSNQINFGSIDNYHPFRILTCWIKVFIISIKLGSNDRITLLLKLNFNPIVQHHQLFRELWNTNDLPIKINDDIPTFKKKNMAIQLNTQRFKQSKEYRQRDPNGMVEIIKVLLDNYQQHQQAIITIQQQHQHQQQLQNMENDNQHDDDDQESTRNKKYYKSKQIEMISKLPAPDLVINYLFRMLIQSNGEIQLDTIKSIYKLINDSHIIKVQQSTLFSIYYLSLKSKYFIKYIATSPYLLLTGSDKFYYYNYFYCLDATQGKIKNVYLKYMVEFDLALYINPQVFTFEFVLLSNNNSFINILKALVDRYMVKPFQDLSTKDVNENVWNQDSLLNQVINHTLSIILEVREFDLFFSYLEQLKNHSTNYFNQHIQFTDSLFESIVLAVNQDALYKLLKEYQPQFNRLIYNGFFLIQVLWYYNEINSIIPIIQPRFSNAILVCSDLVVKYHALLFGDNKITDYKFGSIDFKYYSIDHYTSLINQYPNNPVFKLSKSSITQLIQSKSIIKLKQLYQNQLINDQPSENDQYDKLLSYLKFELKQHNINCTHWLN